MAPGSEPEQLTFAQTTDIVLRKFEGLAKLPDGQYRSTICLPSLPVYVNALPSCENADWLQVLYILECKFLKERNKGRTERMGVRAIKGLKRTRCRVSLRAGSATNGAETREPKSNNFSQTRVQRKFFMGNQVLKVFAAKDDEAAAVALSSLVHALDELDMVAVVRYVYDRRANPQVGVAFPYIKDAYECLVYVQLPFMEDLRQYMFSSLKNNKKFTPTEAQLSAVDALIDSMSLVKKDKEEDTIEDLFPTTKIPNPEFQRLFQCLLHRALHPQEPLPPIQQHILNMLDPPTEVTAKCQIPLSKIKTLFPLTEAIKKKDQVTAQDIFQDNHEEGPTAKKCKTEEGETPFSVSNLAEGSVTKVGSVNPAENFRALVRQKNASFEEASHQLISHIEQFLDTNETPYFMKSMDCIKAFREEAIQFSEEQHFNSFLKDLREKVEVKRLNHFWDIVVQDGITLITKDEASGSSVTAEEAKKFLAPKEKPQEDTAAMFEGGDVDDLLDMM